MNTNFARLHLEITGNETLPIGGLADLVKRYKLHTQPQECFWIIGNDAAGNVHTILEVARGRQDAVEVDIPSALTAVLMTGAPAFSIAHNHPTKSVLPSMADLNLTHNFMDAANVLGLLFEDHVIVDPTGDSLSFRAAGYINGKTRAPAKAASRKGKR
jgi:DNA repair protein RadC